MNNLIPITQNNQRVLLTSQLAEQYSTSERTIVDNFNNNKARYQEGKHYFLLQGESLRAFKGENENFGFAPNLNKLYLWTQHGALLHAKSLNTDRAWEVYGELVDTYFKAHEMQAKLSELSPQLQLLINIEIKQKQMEQSLYETNRHLENIGELVCLRPNAWRKDCKAIISKIANKQGGFEFMHEIQAEIYKTLNERFGTSIETRLTNKRRRMAEEGMSKSQRDKLTKLDVIAEDKKLIEGYISIVKEMAVKYGIS